MEKEKTRYNDEELQEFREIILKKMEIAKDEFKTIQNNLKDGNQGGGVGTNNKVGTITSVSLGLGMP